MRAPRLVLISLLNKQTTAMNMLLGLNDDSNSLAVKLPEKTGKLLVLFYRGD